MPGSSAADPPYAAPHPPNFGQADLATVAPPFDRITVEPGKCGGKPCIRGMRITVRWILELLATYPDRASLLEEYPDLEDADLQQALGDAAATVDDGILDSNRVA